MTTKTRMRSTLAAASPFGKSGHLTGAPRGSLTFCLETPCYHQSFVVRPTVMKMSSWLGMAFWGASFQGCAVYDTSLALPGNGGAPSTSGPAMAAGNGGTASVGGATGMGGSVDPGATGGAGGSGGSIDPGSAGASGSTNAAGGASGAGGIAGAGDWDAGPSSGGAAGAGGAAGTRVAGA